MKVEKLELNSKGIREMLRSEEMKQICKEYTDSAAEALGEGYESEGYTGRNRVNAELIAVTHKAVSDNKRDNRMIKAVLSR